jgi:hypothetical protein
MLTKEDLVKLAKENFALEISPGQASEILERHARISGMALKMQQSVSSIENFAEAEFRKMQATEQKEKLRDRIVGLYYASANLFKEIYPEGKFYFLDHSSPEKLQKGIEFLAGLNDFHGQWASNRKWLRQNGIHSMEHFVAAFLANIKKRLEIVKDRALLPGNEVFLLKPNREMPRRKDSAIPREIIITPVIVSSITRQGFLVFLGAGMNGQWNPEIVFSTEEAAQATLSETDCIKS